MEIYIILVLITVSFIGTAWSLLAMINYITRINNIEEEIQLLHDTIYSNEGKQVLHLKFGRRKEDRTL